MCRVADASTSDDATTAAGAAALSDKGVGDVTSEMAGVLAALEGAGLVMALDGAGVDVTLEGTGDAGVADGASNLALWWWWACTGLR